MLTAIKRNAFMVGIASTMTLVTTASYAVDKDEYQLSSHILDISTGEPAANVNIQLLKQTNGSWTLVDSRKTTEGGRVSDFLPNDGTSHQGTYKLIFETSPYFRQQGLEPFFPYIEVNFNIEGDTHYHVPITLSPYGYSTYKGS